MVAHSDDLCTATVIIAVRRAPITGTVITRTIIARGALFARTLVTRALVPVTLAGMLRPTVFTARLRPAICLFGHLYRAIRLGSDQFDDRGYG